MAKQQVQDIGKKLWDLCNILRDDGITYHQYLTELSYLLFIKVANELDKEAHLPVGYYWQDYLNLKDAAGEKLLEFYQDALTAYSRHENKLVAAIYANASTYLRQAKHLEDLVTEFEKLNWYSVEKDQLGDLYEDLLERNASEVKSGAGQYFTPRPLIKAMVEVLNPTADMRIFDPASGTGGFLIAADQHIRVKNVAAFDALKELEQDAYLEKAMTGLELVPETYRLGLMNCFLHDLTGDESLGPLRNVNTLGGEANDFKEFDLILSNPPFGTKKGGGKSTRGDIAYNTSNKQLAFLQVIYHSLKEGGMAGVVLPDNVLFEGGLGRDVREELMGMCNLHTILRLPTGLFYAQGVKTNVLFFTRGQGDTGNTADTWVYDLRNEMPNFGKTSPFTFAHLKEFIAAYGDRPDGTAQRKEAKRFKKYSYTDIEKRGFNLDLSWMADDAAAEADEPEAPEVILDQIEAKFDEAATSIKALRAILGEES